VAQGPAQRLGLLKNLFDEVVGELAHGRSFGRPVQRLGLPGHNLVLQRLGDPFVLPDDDHLAVLEEGSVAGGADEGSGVGGKEDLAVALADHEGAAVFGADEQVGVIGEHGDDAVGAHQARQGAAHRFFGALGGEGVEVGLDQVRDHLGVGLAAKLVALLG